MLVKKIQNEEFHNVYSTDIIRVIKSRRMRLTGYVAGVGFGRRT
jgi:hypothetical protein